jgi:hypothetical protein
LQLLQLLLAELLFPLLGLQLLPVWLLALLLLLEMLLQSLLLGEDKSWLGSFVFAIPTSPVFCCSCLHVLAVHLLPCVSMCRELIQEKNQSTKALVAFTCFKDQSGPGNEKTPGIAPESIRQPDQSLSAQVGFPS